MNLFEVFNFAKDLIANFGYFGVFFGVFLEGVFPPIPSEVIMGFSGFLIAEGRFSWFGVILSAVLGNFLSVSLIWFLGKKYGKTLIFKWGKFVGVNQKEMNFGTKLFNKYGYGIVFVCQMIPIARTLIAFPAGFLGTKYYKFIIANSAGATIWLTFLTYLGFIFGENWENIENIIKPFERIILVMFILFFIYWIIKIIIELRKNLQKE